MKTFLKNFFLVTFPTLVVLMLLLEVVFRTIIPAAESPWGLYDKRYNVMRFDPSYQKKGRYSIGSLGQECFEWSINREGWNSPFEYDTVKNEGKTRIAVIGDSYIESLMVDNTKHYSTLLKEKLGDNYEVYSFGISGAPLSQYLQMSRYVNQRFNPDILIVNCVYNDFAQSIDLFDSNRYYFMRLALEDSLGIKEIAPKPRIERRFRLLKKSAIVRYFVNNKKSFRQILKRQVPADEKQMERKADYHEDQKLDFLVYGPEKEEVLMPVWKPVERATDYLVGKFMEENKNKRRVIFLMDGPRINIYDGTQEQNLLTRLETILEQTCKKHGAEYISLTPFFESDYAKHHQRFDNDRDMHWNPYAHSLIAGLLFDYLT